MDDPKNTADADAVRERQVSDGQLVLLGDKSPGVARIEAVNKFLTFGDRMALFIGVFFIAYAYSLDGTVRSTYQTTALASFNEHSLLATVNVVRTVIAAAAQPTAAKVADVFGRVELVFVSIFFYVLGSIICAVANTPATFGAGAVLYQIGYTVVTLLVEVIVADVSSLRSRLFFSYISATPFIINTWISGDVSSSVLAGPGWRWGIGMWCIIYPVCSLPLIVALMVASRRAKKAGALADYKTPYQTHGLKKLLIALFWELDVIGIILMIAVFGLILTPLTLAGGVSKEWKSAHIIVMIVIGICCIPVFVLWERWCPHPLVPFRLLKDRGVWGALGMAWILDFAWYMQGDYLYTLLIVAFNESVKAATRVSSLYSFVSVLTGVGLSLVVRFGVPYLKPFILFGCAMFLVSFGLLIEFRGGSGTGSNAGIIGAQCLLGFSAGFFTYPAQTSIQSASKHEHVAIVTGLYLAVFNIGSAFGSTVSGAVWTQVLPGALESRLAQFNNATLATAAYDDPLVYAEDHAWGSPERMAAVEAWRHTQKILCIVGACLCVPLLCFALCLRNPRLTKAQSLPGAEERSQAGSGHASGSVSTSGFDDVDMKEPESESVSKKGGMLRKIFLE